MTIVVRFLAGAAVLLGCGLGPSSAANAQKPNGSWAFEPLKAVQPPSVQDPSWCKTPIDQFVLAKLESNKLAPNPPADRRTLARRAALDLTGLPPSPELLNQFVQDRSANADERLIDELLASPHHGERWARFWLDSARFAESHGFEQDYDRTNAFHFRDFVIQAFNSNLPYDQFVRWQLAGDELAPDQPLALMATGFLGAGVFPTQLTEKEFESARYDELDDMVSTMGTTMLGLTIGCARCHDHKFDPISTREYYQLVSTFTTTIRSEIELKISPSASPTKVMVTSEGFKPMKHHADDRGFPHFYPQTHLLQRGDINQKKDVVSQSFLRLLMREGKTEQHWQRPPPPEWTRTSYRRLALANWITDADHGAGQLLARVIVNRIWHGHFGRGIVATPNDFGAQGDPPTHPELLDWLARDLIAHGWDLKHLHKLIMTSAVYQQGSTFAEPKAKVDPENRWLWRFAPRRLEAEAIRDSLLAVSGLLDRTMFGPGTLDPNMRRRSIYFFIKRSKLIPIMVTFDWPEPLASIGRRPTTTVAPQALLLMNNPTVRACATALAQRIAAEPSVAQGVQQAFHLTYARPPEPNELDLADNFIRVQTTRYQEAGRPDPAWLAWTDLCQSLLASNEFLYLP